MDCKVSKADLIGGVDMPPLVEVDYSKIPEDLKAEPRWLVWKYEQRFGKWAKVPIDLQTGRYINSTDPSAWHTFDEVAYSDVGHGIGFALGNGISGVDLDDCRNPVTAELTPLAEDVLQRADSYAEVSPTGTGIKIVLRTATVQKFERTKNSSGTVEIYQSGRYFTFTGHQIGESGNEFLPDRSANLRGIYGKYIASQITESVSTPATHSPATNAELLDGVLSIGPFENENDGSKRLFVVQCRIRGLGGIETDAIPVTREYEKVYPFPRKYSDSEILRRYRDACQKVGLGSEREPDWEKWGAEPSQIGPWFQALPDFCERHSEPREIVVDGIAQCGDVVNVIAPSKFGKTFFTYQLALSVAGGSPWFGHDTKQGSVLIVDNELYADTITSRIRKVREAMRLPASVESNIFVASLRGNLVGLDELCKRLSDEQPGRFVLVILDALYRMQPKGTDENANGDITKIYNMIDQTATRLGCAIVLVHHASKGDQSRKAVTDVGSGAGAQSRAADCHLVLRPHASEGCVTMQAAIRAFPSIQPVVLKREFPLWVVDQSADPGLLRDSMRSITADDFQAWLQPGEHVKTDLIKQLATDKGLSLSTAKQIVNGAIGSRVLELVPRTNSNQKQHVKRVTE